MPNPPPVPPRPTIDPDRAAALLIAWRQGRSRAVDELIELCAPFVRRQAERYAWRRTEVDDIAQEVWVRLIAKSSLIRDPQTLLAWLQIVTRRVAAQHGHREARLVPSPVDEEEHPAPCSTEDEAIDRCHRDHLTKRVRTALGELSNQDRHLLLLLHRDDRPGYEAIGRVVQRPTGSLGPSRMRLLKRLRKDRRLEALRDLPEAG